MDIPSFHTYDEKTFNHLTTTDQCYDRIAKNYTPSHEISYEMFHDKYVVLMKKCFLGNETYNLCHNHDLDKSIPKVKEIVTPAHV